MENKNILDLEKKIEKLEEECLELRSLLDFRKIVIKLPDGNFKYEIIKGEGIQNKIFGENEEWRCSGCGGFYTGIDDYRYYDGEVECEGCGDE